MDADTQRRLERFIETKWKHGACPVCGVDSWQVGNEIAAMAMSEMYASDIMAAMAAYPLFPIFCTNCGYALLFNAQIAGLVGPGATSEAEAESEGLQP